LVLLYLISLFWAIKKDNTKEVYAPNLEGKTLTTPNPVPEMRQMELDYTAETIDITSITSEDIRHYSQMGTNLDNISSAGTPANAGRETTFKFESPASPVNRRGDDDPTSAGKSINLELSEIRADHMMPAPTDDSIFRSTKRESRRRTSSVPLPPPKKKETICSKFKNLLLQRHIIISTKARMSRINPRWKRIGLIFILFYADLLVSSFSYIDSSFQDNEFSKIMQTAVYSWIGFALISRLSAVSKDRLKRANTTQDFQSALYSIESESKLKNVVLQLIVILFFAFSYIQFGLFAYKYKSSVNSWLITSSIVALVQLIIFEMSWTLMLAYIYTRAYQSKLARLVYRKLSEFRFWRI
jgi:hypothetical protein